MLHPPCILGGRQKRRTQSKRAQKTAEMLHHPCIPGDFQKGGTKSKRAQKWAQLLHHRCIQGHPQTKEDRNRVRCLSTAFSGAKKWAEMLHQTCNLGDPPQRGHNPSGLQRGRKCYITPALWGVFQKGDKIKAGPKEGGKATSPLHSRGSPTKATKSKRASKCAKMHITPELSGVPNNGDRIKTGPKEGGTPGSSLHARLSPNKGGHIRNRLPQPCFVGGPKPGSNATSLLRSRRCQTKGRKPKRAQKREEMLNELSFL